MLTIVWWNAGGGVSLHKEAESRPLFGGTQMRGKFK